MTRSLFFEPESSDLAFGFSLCFLACCSHWKLIQSGSSVSTYDLFTNRPTFIYEGVTNTGETIIGRTALKVAGYCSIEENRVEPLCKPNFWCRKSNLAM